MEQQILDFIKYEYGNNARGGISIVKDKVFSKINNNFVFIG